MTIIDRTYAATARTPEVRVRLHRRGAGVYSVTVLNQSYKGPGRHWLYAGTARHEGRRWYGRTGEGRITTVERTLADTVRKLSADRLLRYHKAEARARVRAEEED